MKVRSSRSSRASGHRAGGTGTPMPPYVRKPSVLGDPSVVAGWRFLSDKAASPRVPQRRRPAEPDRPAEPRQLADAVPSDTVEGFLEAAGEWDDESVDGAELVAQVEALLEGSPDRVEREPSPEPVRLPPIATQPTASSMFEASSDEESEAAAGFAVNFDNYTYGDEEAPVAARESLDGHAVGAGGGGGGGGGEGGAAGAQATGEVDAAADGEGGKPAASPAREEPAGRSQAAGRGRRRGTRGAVVALPSVAVDSSFTYTPRQQRARKDRYGAWYLPIKSWKKGGVPKPPPKLTDEERKQIEQTAAKRQEIAMSLPTSHIFTDNGFKEFLYRKQVSEGLAMLRQARSAFSDDKQYKEFEDIVSEFESGSSNRLSSAEAQRRVQKLLGGGLAHRQQLLHQFLSVCSDQEDIPRFLRDT